MAETTSTTSGPSIVSPHAETLTTNGNEPPHSLGGRGRGRGRGGRGPRGGRGRGRGQGQGPRQSGGATARPVPPETATDWSYGRPPGGSFRDRLTEAASNNQGDSKALPSTTQQGKEVADEQEVCFICASPIEHVSIAPCDHQTCHICALRLRALYKTRACAHCRVSYTKHGPNCSELTCP